MALGRAGLIVQSQLLAGGDFRTDAILWRNIWRRSVLNPQSGFDYEGTVDSRELALEDVAVTAARRYVVWVVCNANVYADPGFAAATRASAAIRCGVPFLFVEEKPA